MNDQSIFDKNLKLFSRFSEKFVADVLSADSSHAELSQIQEIPNLKKVKSLFIYGLVPRFYYEVAKNWLEENQNRNLIFLENDFSLIRRFLESPQATEILSHPQVVVQAFKTPQGQKIPEEFEWISWTFARFSPKIVALKQTKETDLIRMMLHISFAEVEEYMVETSEKAMREVYTCVYFNLHLIPNVYRGQNLQDVFRGIPSLICGAGPSLSKIFHEIKDLKNKALIFGAGTGMNVLNKLGMIPHFGGGLDPFIESLQRIKTNYAYEVPYFYMNSFQYYALRAIHGPILFFRTESKSTIQDWFEKELEITDTKTIKTTVSTTSYLLNVAQFLGCSPLILAGIDLAYTDNARYPKEIQSHPLDPPFLEKLLKDVSLGLGKIIPLKNAEGDLILTRYDWIAEAESYTAFAKTFPENKLMNITKGGFTLTDVPNPTIQEVPLHNDYDLINLVHAAIQRAGKMPITKEKLAKTYDKWKKSLQNCSAILSERIKVLKSGIIPLESEIKEPAFEYLLKQMIDTHEKITYRNMHQYTHFPELFSEKDKFTKALEFEESKMQFLLFIVNMHLEIIDKAIHVEVESVAAKPILGGSYSIENGRLIIQDEELHIDEPFQAEKNAHKSIPGEYYTLNGQFHGPSRFFSNEGKLLAEGWFYNGKRIGKNWLYYTSGSLYSLQRFKEGEWHGAQDYFYENGQKKSIIRYSQGLLDGKVELFYPNGVLAREIHFAQGKLHGMEREWQANGKLVSECQYDMNTPLGTSRRWYPNGILAIEKVYYDSTDHFDLRQWDVHGNKIVEELYIKDLGKQFLEDSKERRETIENLKKQIEQMKRKE